MQISLIIPIYNAGKYLRSCLESVINQTFKDFEVLLVLDCPTDGSDLVCREYAAQDERIRLIENEANLHIGNSRNKALSLAKGEYIAFADHDDILETTLLERLWQKARETQADVILSPVQTTLKNDSTNNVLFPNVEDKRNVALHDLLARGGNERADSLYNLILGALYKRDTIGYVRFVDTRTMSAEDKLFQTEMLYRATRVEWVNESLYTHINHSTNAGSTSEYLGFPHTAAAMEYLYEHVSNWSEAAVFLPSLYVGLNKQMLSLAAAAWFRGPKTFQATRRAIYQTPCFAEAIKHYNLSAPQSFAKRLYRRLLLWSLGIKSADK